MLSLPDSINPTTSLRKVGENVRRCRRYFLDISIQFLSENLCQPMLGPYNGTDGVPYIAIDWIEEPEFYFDDNPLVPGDFQRNEFYQTEPGIYNFEYGYSDGYGWGGIYMIKKAQPGGKGSFFRERGEDGENSHYTLLLSYNGTDFTNEPNLVSGDKVIARITDGHYEILVKMHRIIWDSTKVANLKLGAGDNSYE